MKKTIIILAGFAVLAAGGYAAGQVLTKKKNNDSFVQLEDGRRMKINGATKGGGGEFNREGERADVVGRIKSIDGDKMVVEKFEMPSGGMGTRRGDGGGANGEQSTSSEDESTVRTERPEPTVAGEETISFSDDTSFVKGPERGRGRRGGGSGDMDLEEISKSDLSEGSMISVWLTDDGVAQRVMVR